MNDQTFEGEEIFAEPERAPAATKPNGHATGAAPAKAPKPKSKFASVGADTMRTAKKGGVSKSRTGKARQVTVEFGKPPKHLYVKVHPNPEYRQNGIAIFFDQDRDTAHYIPADLYEGDTLPERFKRACKSPSSSSLESSTTLARKSTGWNASPERVASSSMRCR